MLQVLHHHFCSSCPAGPPLPPIASEKWADGSHRVREFSEHCMPNFGVHSRWFLSHFLFFCLENLYLTKVSFASLSPTISRQDSCLQGLRAQKRSTTKRVEGHAKASPCGLGRGPVLSASARSAPRRVSQRGCHTPYLSLHHGLRPPESRPPSLPAGHRRGVLLTPAPSTPLSSLTSLGSCVSFGRRSEPCLLPESETPGRGRGCSSLAHRASL